MEKNNVLNALFLTIYLCLKSKKEKLLPFIISFLQGIGKFYLLNK